MDGSRDKSSMSSALPKMMYSPTVLERRPRPPGAVPHRTINLYSHASTDSSGSLASDTPLRKQLYTRRHDSNVADADEEDEVSIELQGVSATGQECTKVIGLGLPHSISTKSRMSTIVKDSTSPSVQASPPPPYGPSGLLGDHVASVSTPPTQDIEDDPLESANNSPKEEDEEESRRRRASEAAKSLGLAMEFSPTTDGSVEEGMDVDEIKLQLKQMRRRLKDRDHELIMAAQAANYVLKQHEDLVSALPPNVRAMLPHLAHLTTPFQSAGSVVDSDEDEPDRILDCAQSSSSSALANTSVATSPITHFGSKRLFRTVRNDDLSRPFPHHHHKHARNIFNSPATPRSRPSTAYAEAVQQEADERLLRLERALSESRENEDHQRKVAARLKRDFDKLQRDFDHAEESMAAVARQQMERPALKSTESTSSSQSMTSSQFDSWAWKQNVRDGDEQVLRPRTTKLKLRIKPKNRVSSQSTQGDQPGEDSSAWGLTKFPEFPGEASHLGDRLTRLPPRPTFSKLKAKLRTTSPKKASPRRSPVRHQRVSSETMSDQDSLASGACRSGRSSAKLRGRNARPEITQETFTREHSRSRSNSSHSRYRHSPSRRPESTRPGSPSRAPVTPHTRYNSISSHLASVRKYVTDSVRSVAFAGSRSLGSELGSDYGDHIDANDMWQDDDPKSGSDGTETGPYSQPIAIPANASSGLNSLAIALAPNSPLKTKRVTPRSKSISTPKRSGLPQPKQGSPTRSPVDEFDPGSYRPKKGRRNWIRPLQLSISHGLDTMPMPIRQRPMLHPRTSSDGTVALAHRRLAESAQSTALDNTRSEQEELYDLVQTIVDSKTERTEQHLELSSPPARLVNDIIILLSILLEWIEMLIIIIWRVSIAVRYGRESIFRTWRQGRTKRYYL